MTTRSPAGAAYIGFGAPTIRGLSGGVALASAAPVHAVPEPDAFLLLALNGLIGWSWLARTDGVVASEPAFGANR